MRWQNDLRGLNAGFEVWIDWYRDRLDGKPVNWELERQWALLSKEQLSQSPAEINAYLKALREGSLTKQLKRVRAIFIGHGEAGKTSLIRALTRRGCDRGKGGDDAGRCRHGFPLQDRRAGRGLHQGSANPEDDDLTVHFWDFGGQVMAHATHQFFLRSNASM